MVVANSGLFARYIGIIAKSNAGKEHKLTCKILCISETLRAVLPHKTVCSDGGKKQFRKSLARYPTKKKVILRIFRIKMEGKQQTKERKDPQRFLQQTFHRQGRRSQHICLEFVITVQNVLIEGNRDDSE